MSLTVVKSWNSINVVTLSFFPAVYLYDILIHGLSQFLKNRFGRVSWKSSRAWKTKVRRSNGNPKVPWGSFMFTEFCNWINRCGFSERDSQHRRIRPKALSVKPLVSKLYWASPLTKFEHKDGLWHGEVSADLYWTSTRSLHNCW